jgi:hypothetical protein
MGINQCCKQDHFISEKNAFKDNEGESFIRKVIMKSKLIDIEFITLYKAIVGEEYQESLPLNKKKFLVEASRFGDISITYFYEPDVIKNSLSNIQACFFSYVAVTFSKELIKVDCLKVLKVFLSFFKNTHSEKLDIFCSLNSEIFDNKVLTTNYSAIRNVVKDYLIFLLQNITYEISLTIFNEINKYRDILKDINLLCKLFSEKNIEFFLDNSVLDKQVYLDKFIEAQELKEIWKEKTFLFDFLELRNNFLILHQKS